MIFNLNNNLIYTQDKSQAQVNAVRWVLNKLRKYDFFANFKKCCFYKNEVCFLGYVVSAQSVQMRDEQIEMVTNWPKPKSIRDI